MNTFNKTVLVILLALSVAPLCAQQSYLNGTQLQYACDSSLARLSQNNLMGFQTDSDSTGLYKFSAGLSLNTVGGAYTIKYRISNKCAFQTDLGVKYFINLVKDDGGISPVMLILLDVSQNFLYHHLVATKENKNFYCLLGAGVSGGLTPYGPVTWKAGANPLVGLEIVLKKPRLSFQIDLRPGYAALLRSEKAQHTEEHPYITAFTSGIKQYPYHGYDISLNFAVRFYKKE